jgi:hypothetical protein
MPAESLVIAYYTKALHQSIAIWVKRSKKATLLEDFEEATQIEKDILSLKDPSSNETETVPSSKKNIQILPRPTQNKTQPENSDLENLTKVVQKLSNQVVDLKRSTEESSLSKGPYKPPFRNPFPQNRPNPNPEGLNLESLQCALQTIIGAQDDLIPLKRRLSRKQLKKKSLLQISLVTSQIVSSKPTLRLCTLTILGARPQINLLL